MIVASFAPAIERAELELQEDLPALSRPVLVDLEMWEKVVLNLLSNALKFTLAGHISISLREADEIVELEVSDTGIGIPREEIPQLFERFHRVGEARGRSHEGSGIGLALVHELVSLHGGAISARSELGSGSSFFVRLPYGQVAGAEAVAEARLHGSRQVLPGRGTRLARDLASGDVDPGTRAKSSHWRRSGHGADRR